METLLVFLAIAAIQMLAAYSKQKKEAAKRKYAPPPQATQPIPDPFGEEPEFEFEPEPDPEPEPKPILEIKPEPPKPIPAARPVHYVAAATKTQLSPAAQGFIWAAILQEPRYKVKWKQR